VIGLPNNKRYFVQQDFVSSPTSQGAGAKTPLARRRPSGLEPDLGPPPDYPGTIILGLAGSFM
jgi:hypothetical protein